LRKELSGGLFNNEEIRILDRERRGAKRNDKFLRNSWFLKGTQPKENVIKMHPIHVDGL